MKKLTKAIVIVLSAITMFTTVACTGTPVGPGPNTSERVPDKNKIQI